MVERSLGSLEWQGSPPSSSRLCARNRCLSPRLASLLRRDSNGRSLGFTQTEAPYKLPRTNCRVLCTEIFMDNVPAVSYINKMGGTHSHLLSNIAVRLWEWCLQHHLIVSAQHLPGVLNTRAEWKSRTMVDAMFNNNPT